MCAGYCTELDHRLGNMWYYTDVWWWHRYVGGSIIASHWDCLACRRRVRVRVIVRVRISFARLVQ